MQQGSVSQQQQRQLCGRVQNFATATTLTAFLGRSGAKKCAGEAPFHNFDLL
jgi:hypothetical protein